MERRVTDDSEASIAEADLDCQMKLWRGSIRLPLKAHMQVAEQIVKSEYVIKMHYPGRPVTNIKKLWH